MNKIKLNFASPEKTTSNGIPKRQSINEVLENTNENGRDTEANTEPHSPTFVIKAPRPDSKLILQNMEEVLNSVKKKHRQKHRRKREQKKLAQLEAEAVAVAIKANAMKEESLPKTRNDKKKSKKPLQEKTGQLENGVQTVKSSKHRKTSTSKSPLKTVATNETILKHFSRTPKKDEAIEEKKNDCNKETETKTATPKIAANAFEVLMNARNKSIGSNTPGKEAPTVTLNEPATGVANVKRKIFLQEWADKKGGAKRKIDEESRAAYVDKQLENRAKRFKKILTKPGCASTSKAVSPTKEKLDKPQENSGTRTKKDTRNNKADKSSNSAKPLPVAVAEVKDENFAIKAKKKSDADKLEKPNSTRGRKRLRRLSSVDSIELKVSNTQDSETAEFLSKLSSPTKKRDSLLGYFPKKESPKEIANKLTKSIENTAISINSVDKKVEETDTPKRTRRSQAKRVVEDTPSKAIELQTTPVTTAATTSTPVGRPRRSCAGKARYDYDLQVSPTKLEKTSKSTHVGSKISTSQLKPSLSEESTEIIDLDDSNTNITPQQTPTKKLAPLFVRAVPKPTPDPAMVKARQDFLMSGVPEKLRLEKAKQKQFEQSYDEALELFPKVCHVLQLSEEELQLLAQKVTLSFKIKPEIDRSNINHGRRSKESRSRAKGSITNCSAKEFRIPTKTFSIPSNQPLLSTLDNKRAIIKSWKTDFERFPTYKCYNQMREKYRYFSAIDSAQDTEQVTESFVVTRRTRRSLEAQKKFDPDAEEEKPPPTAPNGELLFTEKYKPMLFEQVLVNLTPVTQLRDFLSNWSAGLSARNSQGIDESFDFANDSNSSQQSACNTVVLLGPGSSGKTNAVFALANELNFNVLEINAGMKRTGKKMIQELQEATQSHQIVKESNLHGGKVQKNLLKISLNGLKTKQSSQNVDSDGNSSSPGADLVNTVRKSLILIEDADIVFDQMDAGFTDAIYTLAASSKRPVIVVANNSNCQHLQRLMNQNTIHFSSPNVLNISKFLAILALIENCPVNLDDLISLYLYNQRNLRKTLLELQFFIQSGGDGKQLESVSTQKKEKSTQGISQFFASPSKRRFSEEPTSSQNNTENDELLSKEIQATKLEVKGQNYIHRNLFEFYSVAQNEKYRIPFPIDFHLLRINLNDVFHVSKKLRDELSNKVGNSSAKSGRQAANTTKRKTRSPKKLWLNTAAAELSTPLDALSDFYENISVASLLCAHNSDSYQDINRTHFADRLVSHLAEDISHSLVERAIESDLEAAACPYNLFDTPKERHSLIDQMYPLIVRTQRTCSLDFEPALRSICRSEKLRSTLERRSTRFYHYLRNGSVNLCNFSTEHFDNACSILYDDVAITEEVVAVDNAALSL